MSVVVEEDRIILSGAATVEDAEPLLAALLEHPHHRIDIAGLARAHLAVVQLVLAAGRPVIGRPESPFLREIAFASPMQIEV
ncbi:hypothetical protein A0J57_12260 [Sphingobium sp. 22B]|uniref:hypothetical protein n=1 Tax=unclassified Sphingobium TaxID=2611147 RepID=UPI0007864248|nr:MULTISPECIES: hypothetical protein [unclassified Sphingobium]KXU32205.1 hypothetical protein AXW74_08780 [Sphingobium sp. AM]KYC32099.1 hypothetical protein A0J57_12260 [Sphingobium sp. 22B]OAP33101.1 hypothetical protein A8O16_04315 [Sphingobium sp. 20006FA]